MFFNKSLSKHFFYKQGLRQDSEAATNNNLTVGTGKANVW